MRYRKLSPSGDYQFGSGRKDFYVDKAEGVGQAVVTRLLLWAGEWFLDVTEGTPYQAGALGKHTKATIDPMIRDRILGTEGVIDISRYVSIFDAENRKFSVEATVNTIYGQVTIQQVL